MKINVTPRPYRERSHRGDDTINTRTTTTGAARPRVLLIRNARTPLIRAISRDWAPFIPRRKAAASRVHTAAADRIYGVLRTNRTREYITVNVVLRAVAANSRPSSFVTMKFLEIGIDPLSPLTKTLRRAANGTGRLN